MKFGIAPINKGVASPDEMIAHARLAEQAGVAANVLLGGYKAFRVFAHMQFSAPRKLVVVAGPTGSGKTEYLQSLSNMSLQVVDLEV